MAKNKQDDGQVAEQVASLRDDDGMAWKAIGDKFGFSASKARTLYRKATGRSHTKSKRTAQTSAPQGTRMKDLPPDQRKRIRKENEAKRRKELTTKRPYFTDHPDEEEVWEVLQPGKTITVRMGTELLDTPFIEEYSIKRMIRIARYDESGDIHVEYHDKDTKFRSHNVRHIMEVR